MITNVTSSIFKYDETTFKSNQNNSLNDIKNNTKESISDVQQREQNNKTVDQTIKADENKFSQKTDSDIRKSLMRQLNSPFPLISTEIMLKSM
jgi:hypothetical protein